MTTITITAATSGQRLDTALATLTGRSRHQIERAIKEGRVQSNGRAVVTKQATVVGQSFELTDAETEAPCAAPDLVILYQDDDIIAIDKPAGLVVHASESGRSQPTVAAFAAAQGIIDEDTERPGIVHRLDKDTSGVMLLAKHPVSKHWLQQQFKQRLVGKTYTALVRGHLRENQAIIRLPVGRDRRAPVKRAVVPGGREAVTEYKVIRPLKSSSLVEITLHTGRTHQIRVHFQHLGHPVLGDTFYGESKRPPGLTRQFLHANRIEVLTPTGKTIEVVSPLPPDLQAFLRELEKPV